MIKQVKIQLGDVIRRVVPVIRSVFQWIYQMVLAVLFVVVLFTILFMGIFAIKYETWVRSEGAVIEERAIRHVADEEGLRVEIERRLTDFTESPIQKETLFLSCDMLTLIIEDVVDEQWGGVPPEDIGVTCGERTLDVNTKLWGIWWMNTRLWQRSAGSIEFAVYDVEVGPFSLAGWTLGNVSNDATSGVRSAWDLFSGGSYSGRRIERIDLSSGGIRVVGVRE